MKPHSRVGLALQVGLLPSELRRMSVALLVLVMGWTSTGFAKTAKNKPSAHQQNSPSKSKNKRVQEVNFEEMALQGQIRNPYGSYLVQKNGLKFVPLYEVQKDMDEKIRSASEWMR